MGHEKVGHNGKKMWVMHDETQKNYCGKGAQKTKTMERNSLNGGRRKEKDTKGWVNDVSMRGGPGGNVWSEEPCTIENLSRPRPGGDTRGTAIVKQHTVPERGQTKCEGGRVVTARRISVREGKARGNSQKGQVAAT